MKRLFLFFCITLQIQSSKAQTYGVPDTLVYLQTVITNKNQFVGQPFSKLLDSLKLEIKYFSPFASLPYDMNKETSTTFAFYKPTTSAQFYLIYPCFEVYWHPFLNGTQSNNLFGYFGGGWNPNVRSFYSAAVVADIRIRN